MRTNGRLPWSFMLCLMLTLLLSTEAAVAQGLGVGASIDVENISCIGTLSNSNGDDDDDDNGQDQQGIFGFPPPPPPPPPPTVNMMGAMTTATELAGALMRRSFSAETYPHKSTTRRTHSMRRWKSNSLHRDRTALRLISIIPATEESMWPLSSR